MVTIIDYGVGNLFSLRSSLEKLGVNVCVSGEGAQLREADHLILPGVGAFGDAINKLRAKGLDTVIREEAQRGKPMLGICLGMQLLFDESEEYGNHHGLGLIPGKVVPLQGVLPHDLKIPHIGWNALHFCGEKHPIFQYISEGDYVYFVHSFYATDCQNNLIADTSYGIPLTAAVAKRNVIGCQFHPEKSGNVGRNILKAFLGTEDF